MQSNILGGEVNPIPEILLFHVAADQLRHQRLLGDKTNSSLVLPGVHSLVGSNRSFELHVAQNAFPFIEEDATILWLEAVVVDNFLCGYCVFWVFEIWNVNIGQEFQFVFTGFGDLLLELTMVFWSNALHLFFYLIISVLFDLDLIIYLFVLVL
jgi:hypothetical protein